MLDWIIWETVNKLIYFNVEVSLDLIIRSKIT